MCVCVCHIGTYTYVGLCPTVQLIADTLLRCHVHKLRLTLFKYEATTLQDIEKVVERFRMYTLPPCNQIYAI